MDRLFLDANILYAVACRPRAGLRILWRLGDLELLASPYVCREVHTNLLDLDPLGRSRISEADQIERLDRLSFLLRSVRVIDDPQDGPLPEGIALPDKDRPILLAAIEAKASHLLTADKTHFGRYFGQTVAGILIVPPDQYLRGRSDYSSIR